MEGFKQCTNGHYYKNNLIECPYCPKSGSYTSGMFDKTNDDSTGNNSSGSFDKTQISINDSFNSDLGKTQISGTDTYNKTHVSTENAVAKPIAKDLNKTFIQDSQTDNNEGSTNSIRDSRKLTGWIVSFTMNPMGQDYRIYEGTNTIGRDSSNTITITNDKAVSSKHVSILSKNEKFFIRDEMAANGSFVNNEELEIGRPYDLKDGDEIRIGTTIFKFRTSF